MSPFIRRGSLVRVVPATRIVPGDVIIYEAGERLVAHRVVQLSGEFVVCQGDNRRELDGAISMRDVLGVVAGAVRKDGSERGCRRSPRVVRMVFLARTFAQFLRDRIRRRASCL